MSDTSENWVYFVEIDPDALTRANRRIRVLKVVLLAAFLPIICFVWWAGSRRSEEPWLLDAIAFWAAAALIAGFCGSRGSSPVRRGGVWVGRDFVAGPALSLYGGTAFVKYPDILGVALDISQGRIAGAIIRARRMSVISARYLKDPAAVVGEVFERTPEHVQWRRSASPFTRLSRDEVRALIAKSQPPDINAAPPKDGVASAEPR